jgi:hypothetical protein
VTLRWTVLAALLFGGAFAQGWVGQRRAHPANGDVPDGAPSIAVDASGRPWLVWDTRDTARLGDTTQVFSVWQGDSWGAARGVGPNLPGVGRRLNSSIAFDNRGKAWLVWDNVNEGNTDDIGSSFWADTCWTPEMQVNSPDSTELDFNPEVACGGGQVWCVWYGGPTDMTPYSVYASRWDDNVGRWEPEMRVSPPDSTYHWWCDVAVDSQGAPHVVWCNSNRRLICYSYYDSSGWVGPFPVNDTVLVGAPSWADPHIVIDNTGVMHVSYTGAARSATGRDIFYARNDGSGWTPSVRVTQDTLYNYDEWFSDIAADQPDDVWVAWDRQNEGPDQFRVYASHYDGTGWSSEQRLDDDSAWHDGPAAICLDNQSLPWVVWSGISYDPRSSDIFYNRFSAVGICEQENGAACTSIALKMATFHSSGPMQVAFELSVPVPVHLVVLDPLGRRVATLVQEEMSAGIHTLLWNGDAPAGVYFCHLSAGGFETSCKVVLTGR